MKQFKALALISTILFLSANCQNDCDDCKIDQKILFQYEYANSAWGYQHDGWYIDSSGNVHCYDKPSHWYHLDSAGNISASFIDSNLFYTDSICLVIDKAELKSKSDLIYAASEGRIKKLNIIRIDGGEYTYSAFIYNASTNSYKRILLKEIGMYSYDNKSNAATKIYEWMYEINQSL